MTLQPSSFAAWSTAAAAWVVQPGTYALRIGTSSRDLPVEATVVRNGGR
jgi:hypothetical protein